MNEAQITLIFMVGAIAVTAIALKRNKALGSRALLLVLLSTTVVASFMFMTL